jgi:hypothetical protein
MTNENYNKYSTGLKIVYPKTLTSDTPNSDIAIKAFLEDNKEFGVVSWRYSKTEIGSINIGEGTKFDEFGLIGLLFKFKDDKSILVKSKQEYEQNINEFVKEILILHQYTLEEYDLLRYYDLNELVGLHCIPDFGEVTECRYLGFVQDSSSTTKIELTQEQIMDLALGKCYLMLESSK